MEEKDQDTVAGAEPTAGEGTKSGVQEGGSSMGGSLRGAVEVEEMQRSLGCGKETPSGTQGHERGGRGSRYRWGWKIGHR